MVVCLEGCVFHECLLLLSYSFIQEKKIFKKTKTNKKKMQLLRHLAQNKH